MGGPDSVRAYPVAELLAEKGGVASLELVTGAPGFANRPAFGNTTWGQVLQVLALRGLRQRLPERAAHFVSVEQQPSRGSRCRRQFSLPGRVFSRLDVATPLTDRKPSNDRDPQFYFRFGMNF